MSAIPEALKDGVYLASGDTHPQLAGAIATEMQLKLGAITLYPHANTEPYVRLDESVRGKQVIIVQPHGRTPNQSVSDSFHQQLEMLNAAYLASAAHIIAVSPSLAGARQDRKVQGRESVSIGLNLQLMETAHANRIVTVDLHSPQSLAAFRGQYDHLSAQPLLRSEMAKLMVDDLSAYVVVSPDIGHAGFASRNADAMGIEMIPVRKRRGPDGQTFRPDTRIDGVQDRTVFMFDDMIDTAGTIGTAAQVLQASQAAKIFVGATHGWFSEPALERLQESPIDSVFITDSLPIDTAVYEALGERLRVLSIAPMIGAALTEIVTNGSVSEMFEEATTR